MRGEEQDIPSRGDGMCKGNEVSMAHSGRLNKVRVANAGKRAGGRGHRVQDASGERAARTYRMLWNF